MYVAHQSILIAKQQRRHRQGLPWAKRWEMLITRGLLWNLHGVGLVLLLGLLGLRAADTQMKSSAVSSQFEGEPRQSNTTNFVSAQPINLLHLSLWFAT